MKTKPNLDARAAAFFEESLIPDGATAYVCDTPAQAQERPRLPKIAVVALNLRPLQRELNRLLAAGQGASADEVALLAVTVAGLAKDISEAITELTLDNSPGSVEE